MADEEKKGLRIGSLRIGDLITGPLNWQNHLKVAVFLVIILIWVCIYGQVKSFFHKEAKPSVGVINSGGAPVDNSTKKSEFDGFSIFNLKFGGTNQ